MLRIPETNFLQGITSISGRDIQAILRRRHQPTTAAATGIILTATVQSAFFGQRPQLPLGACSSAPNIKSIARHLGLTLRQLHSGNYRVNFRDGNETTAYYTGNLEDAVNTAVEMARKRAVSNDCEPTEPEAVALSV
jgi:hypothetical protein